MLAMLLSLILFSSSSAQAVTGNSPLRFTGATVLSSGPGVHTDQITLATSPALGPTTGAQFLYEKLGPSTQLASVSLMNDRWGTVADLMANFDTVAQECSCYYIDVQYIKQNNGSELIGSAEYYLLVSAPGYSAASLPFTIKSTVNLPVLVKQFATSSKAVNIKATEPTARPNSADGLQSAREFALAAMAVLVSAAVISY